MLKTGLSRACSKQIVIYKLRYTECTLVANIWLVLMYFAFNMILKLKYDNHALHTEMNVVFHMYTNIVRENFDCHYKGLNDEYEEGSM